MSDCTRESGTCETCRSACGNKPGWFMPGEVEEVASHLRLTVQELFDRYLLVDWLEPDAGVANVNVFVLSPGVQQTPVGTWDGVVGGREFDADPHGQCVFWDQLTGNCTIHEVKPFECRQYLHGETHAEVHDRHLDVGRAWLEDGPAAQVRELLGREPEAEEYVGGWFGGMFGGGW